ncbi:MAG TPA: hypothetical protein VKW06_03875 [Candidatus Angelobacter sp.]|nr:hypothetical protein [Candidatus Angelobacter sp.]
MPRLLLCVAIVGAGLCSSSSGQSGPPQDPAADQHHHLILKNELVRVFAVNIPEGQQVYVRHQLNFLTVTLDDGRIVMWSEGTIPGMVFAVHAGDARFFLGRAALGMRNDAKTEYRNITIEFFDPRVTNYGYQQPSGEGFGYASTAPGPPPDDRSGFVHAVPLHSAAVRDVRLLPGELLPAADRAVKELVIAVTDLNLQSKSGVDFKKQGGEIAWLNTPTTGLINRGTSTARFVIVEFL